MIIRPEDKINIQQKNEKSHTKFMMIIRHENKRKIQHKNQNKMCTVFARISELRLPAISENLTAFSAVGARMSETESQKLLSEFLTAVSHTALVQTAMQ